jgi:hypothetical protein
MGNTVDRDLPPKIERVVRVSARREMRRALCREHNRMSLQRGPSIYVASGRKKGIVAPPLKRLGALMERYGDGGRPP